jgi:hypothetical protein
LLDSYEMVDMRCRVPFFSPVCADTEDITNHCPLLVLHRWSWWCFLLDVEGRSQVDGIEFFCSASFVRVFEREIKKREIEECELKCEI